MNSGYLTLVAYTHFGAKSLKGVGMYHLVKEAWRRGYLRKVIAVSKNRCQYEFDLQLVEAFTGQSLLINGFNQLKNSVWRTFPSRWLNESIFDGYAAAQLTEPGGILFLTPGMVRTARRGKALGYRIFLYGGDPHPKCIAEAIQIEKEAFHLRDAAEDRNRTWVMARCASQLETVDYIAAISDFAKESYMKHGFSRERIFVAPLGVDVDRFQATPPPVSGDFVYLFVGHVNDATGLLKGLQYLLHAWSELDLRNAKLVVCGQMGPEAQELIQGYQGRLKNVEFTGRVSDPEEYYRKASVLVFPSVAEGFGKVILEAMASGRPVIATPIPKPIVRHGIDGFYVPARDVGALRERMLYLYEHREELTRMGANAAERARTFNWDRFSGHIADIVEQIGAPNRKVS
jgi:glycosyltransferase involved in cell wall biosynthesis